MKLRYLIPCFVAALTMFVSCSDDNDPTYLDEVRVSSSYVAIPQDGGSTTITVTATGDWTLESQRWIAGKDTTVAATPKWLKVNTVSGAAGQTDITFSADATLDGRTCELLLNCGGKTQRINVIQGLSTISNATCAEVIAGPDSKTYRVTGTVTSIANTVYGNWYLNDGTGEVYIYGTLDAKGQSLSIISHSDSASERTIYYNHVSINGITDSYQVGQSKANDLVIADSFSCMSADRIYVLRMTQIDGVVNNCNRELISYDLEGRQLWQISLPSDVVARGIRLNDNDIYLYGMQRLEEYNRALVMRYDSDGTLEWTKTYDEIEQVLDLNVSRENVYFAGTIADSPEQFCIFGLTKDGTQIYTEKVSLPEAYNTYLHYEDTHVSIIQNYEDKPCLWQISK